MVDVHSTLDPAENPPLTEIECPEIQRVMNNVLPTSDIDETESDSGTYAESDLSAGSCTKQLAPPRPDIVEKLELPLDSDDERSKEKERSTEGKGAALSLTCY